MPPSRGVLAAVGVASLVVGVAALLRRSSRVPVEVHRARLIADAVMGPDATEDEKKKVLPWLAAHLSSPECGDVGVPPPQDLPATLNDGVVHLFTFPTPVYALSLTPFGTKVETFLRLAHISFTKHSIINLAYSPTGRMPFVWCQGKCVSDSENIIRWLTEHFHLTMDDELNAQQQAHRQALRTMMEYSFLPAYMRGAIYEGRRGDLHLYLVDCIGCPRWLAPVVMWLYRRMIHKRLRRSGHLVPTKEQYEEALQRDVEALEALFSDGRHYALGSTHATSVDATLFAFMMMHCRLHELYAEKLATTTTATSTSSSSSPPPPSSSPPSSVRREGSSSSARARRGKPEELPTSSARRSATRPSREASITADDGTDELVVVGEILYNFPLQHLAECRAMQAYVKRMSKDIQLEPDFFSSTAALTHLYETPTNTRRSG